MKNTEYAHVHEDAGSVASHPTPPLELKAAVTVKPSTRNYTSKYVHGAGRPTIYTCSCSIHDAQDEDGPWDDDDVELRDEALGNGEEDLTVAVVVHALRDEVLSNGEEELLTIAEEVVVEGLRECRPSASPLKTCPLLLVSPIYMKTVPRLRCSPRSRCPRPLS